MSDQRRDEKEQLEKQMDYFEQQILTYHRLIKSHKKLKDEKEEDAQHPFSEDGVAKSKKEKQELSKISDEISNIELSIEKARTAIRKIRRAIGKLVDEDIKELKEKYKKKSFRVRVKRKEKTFEKGSFTVVRFHVNIDPTINGNISLKDYFKEGGLAYSYQNTQATRTQYVLKGKIRTLYDRSATIDCYFSRLLNPNLYPGDWLQLSKGKKFNYSQYQKEIQLLEQKEPKKNNREH